MMRARCPFLVAAVLLAIACIPEPPPDLPVLPPSRPTIVHGSVVPTASTVLASFPTKFIIPVELADPTQTFQWSAFIDYNAFTNAGAADSDTSEFERQNTRGRIRTLEIGLTAPSSDRCHIVEIIVAQSFIGQGREPVDPPGGDSITWFFSPGGTLEGCPSLDAGIEGGPL